MFEYIYISRYINSDTLADYLHKNYLSSLQFRKESISVLQLIHYKDYHFLLLWSKPPTPRTSTIAKYLADRSPAYTIPSTQLISTPEALLATKIPKLTTGFTKYSEQAESTCFLSEDLHPLGEERKEHRKELGNNWNRNKMENEQGGHKVEWRNICTYKQKATSDQEKSIIIPNKNCE